MYTLQGLHFLSSYSGYAQAQVPAVIAKLLQLRVRIVAYKALCREEDAAAEQKKIPKVIASQRKPDLPIHANVREAPTVLTSYACKKRR